MIAIDSILCPVDFSEFSRRALDYAMALARWYEARVTVLHVQPVGVPAAAYAPNVPIVAEAAVMSPPDRAVLRSRLNTFVEAERAGGVPVRVEVLEGTAWREIVQEAARLRAGLIVLGTHGLSGFERLLLGSVAEKVLRTAPCPVLTVPRAAPDAVPTARGLFTRILVPTDFSDAASCAILWGLALAREAAAELQLLHVFEEPTVSEMEGFPASTLAAYREEYEAWCNTRLQEAVPAAERTWCTVRELKGFGSPHREILRIAAERGSDLIVMGVGRQHGLADRIFGSASQHVVREAACPVLTVRG